MKTFLDIESVIIGTLLSYGKEAMSIAINILTDKDFSLPTCKDVWNKMVSMYDNNKNWDLVNIAHDMQYKSYLANIYSFSAVPTLQMFPDLTKELRKKNLQLELKDAIQDEDMVSIKKKITEVEEMDITQDTGLGIKEAIQQVLEEYDASLNTPKEFPLGFPKIDSMLGGLHRGDLVVIGGCTSHGKTNLSLNIALNIIKNNKKILFINGEMNLKQLIFRLLCMEGKVNAAKVRNKTLGDDDYKKLLKAQVNLSKSPVVFMCKSAPTTNMVEKLIKQHNPDMVIVDYLQLMSDTNIHESRALHVANLARGLKNLAIQYDINVIALSQLNRRASERRPLLSDLRASGGIEEASDVVFVVWENKTVDNYNNEKTENWILLYKNRHGEANAEIQIDFNKQTLKMQEML